MVAAQVDVAKQSPPRRHARHKGVNHLRRLALLTLLLTATSVSALEPDVWAPFEAPWFNNVRSADGLPHSITTSIAQDRSGLIWLGTMGGLVRYDGYRMQVYKASEGATTALPDSYVRALFALPDGGMLVGTDTGGTARFDPSNNSFHVYPVPSDSSHNSKDWCFSADGNRGIWIATDRGLDYLDLHSDSISHIATGSGISPRNFSVLQDKAGNLWLGNNNGLYERPAGSSKFVRPTPPEGVITTVLTNQIWALSEDSEGRLWVGSGQTGVVYKNPDGEWHAVPGFSGRRVGGDQSTVRDFREEAPGDMWIGTDGNGVVAYRAGSDHTRHIAHDQATLSSLPGNAVRSMLKDPAGNVWVATDLGVARYNPTARAAFSLLSSPLAPYSLADTNVHGVFVDSRKRIWLGLGGGRIDMIQLTQASLRHLQLDDTQTYREVQAFAETSDGAIWAGAYGLSRIDPDSLIVQPSMVPELIDVLILSLIEDDGALLIGTYDGAYRYDLRTHALLHFTHKTTDPHSLASNTIRTITRVDGKLWFGTSAGISIANTQGDFTHFTTLDHHSDDSDSLPQNFISSIGTEPSGAIMVGTVGGLGVVMPPDPGAPYKFKSIGTKQGLVSDRISDVLPDADGNMWASTANGIARIDGKTHGVSNLGTRDGLQTTNDTYGDRAAAVALDGTLLFGGMGGLTVIRPRWQERTVPPARLSITYATVNGAVLPFNQLRGNGAAMKIDGRQEHDRNLRADFSLLDYAQTTGTDYSYRLQGLEDNWTTITRGAPPSANYINRPHGHYTLLLRARTVGMHPKTIESQFAVEVAARWYETVIARFVGAVALLLSIYGLVLLRTLYLRQQALELQRQIDESTLELRAANKRLDTLASIDELTGIYNRRRFFELARGVRARGGNREDHPTCIAVFDIDHFKRVNDTYGHLGGDVVIRHFIDVIRGQCRPTDIVGRYGGEEFVLCLPDTSLADGMKIGERMRDLISKTTTIHNGQSITVTTSIGIAQLDGDESIEQWLSRADNALYQAKGGGRDRCVAAA